MKTHLLTLLFALGLSSSLLAAPITLTTLNGGAATGAPQLNLDNLDLSNPTGAQSVDSVLSVSFTGTAKKVQGSVSGQYAAPFLSGLNGQGFGSPDQPEGVDATPYLSTGIGSVTLSFNRDINYLGLLWGSVDNYNSLHFYTGDTLLQSFTGTDVWAVANGNQGAQGTFYVNFNSTVNFNRVVAKSTGYAFEFDNVAYSVAHVPDAASTAGLLGLTLAGLAAVTRRRR